MDNLAAERTIRRHPCAAAGRLRICSIVSSAHRHNLIVEDYLEDVFRSLAYAQQRCPGDLELGSDRLLELLPDRWALSHPLSIRTGRAAEKQNRSDNTRARRARERVARRAKELITP